MDNTSGYAGAVDPSSQPTQSAGSPNFFERALPTAGGILGGLASLPLELAPGIGTALNIGGAGAGAAAGKWLENKLTGQGGGNGVLTSGLEGAAGQGIGAGLGAIAGKLLPSLSSITGKSAGQFLKGQSAPGSLGLQDATQLAGSGVNDIRQLPNIAQHITGEGGALNQGVLKSLMNSGSPVGVDGLISVKGGGGLVNDLVGNDSRVGDTVGNKIIARVNKSVQSMLGGAKGMVGNQQADPLDVLAESRVMRAAAQQASSGAAKGNVEQQGASDIYNQIASELESRAFSPNGVAVPLTDQVKSEIIKGLTPLQSSSPKIFNQLVQQVNEAQNAQDLRSMQSIYVRGSQAAQKTAKATDMGTGTSATDIVKGTSPAAMLLAGHPIGAIGGALTALPVADRAAAGVLGKLSTAIGSKNASKMIPLLARAGGVATATSPNMLPNAVPNTGTINQGASMTPTATPGTPGATGPNIFSALANPTAPGNANASAVGLQALLGMLAPMLLNSTVEGNANQAAQNVQKINQAGALIPQVGQQLQQAGGPQGLLGGLATKAISTLTGGPAASYGGQAEQAQQALAAATGLPAGSIQMPQLTMNNQSAQDAMANLYRILQAAGASPTSAIPQ